MYEHREALVVGFAKAQGIKLLSYFEEHSTMPLAIQREKNIKLWRRSWKLALVENVNPTWRDLWRDITAS